MVAGFLTELATQILNRMKTFLYILIAFCLVSCSSDEEAVQADSGASGISTSFEMLMKSWALRAYEDGSISQKVTIEFKQETDEDGNYIASGRSSVNFFELAYQIPKNGGLKVIRLSVTEIAGSVTENRFETEFFQRLSNVEAFSFSGDELVLSNAKGVKMYFIKR